MTMKTGQSPVLECGCEEMFRCHAHTPYSRKMALNFKKHLSEQRLSTDDELKHAPEQWLSRQAETFYVTGTEKLRNHYKPCFDKGVKFCLLIYLVYK